MLGKWFNLCKSFGKIAPNDYAQRMKRLRKRAGIPYPQNAMRHCFCGYHIGKFKDAARTAMMLGHRNATLLYQTYYEIVKSKAAEDFWNVLPDSFIEHQEQERKRQDEAKRQAAEGLSNCGKAVKDETGTWIPVVDDSRLEDGYGAFSDQDEPS